MKHETYTIRDTNGVMIMEIVGVIPVQMFTQLDGEWRVYQTTGKKRTVCFELLSDAVWTQETRTGAFNMYLWKGTKIIKN